MNVSTSDIWKILGVIGATVGWVMTLIGTYVSLNARIATLEAHSERIPVIEAKLDRLIERPR